MSNIGEKTVIFISYSWDDDNHIAWVKNFCKDLQGRLGTGFDILLDQNQKRGASKSRFMKHGLSVAKKVLIIGTPEYKRKSEKSGGVAYETMVITNEMIKDMDITKFYPILRKGTFATSFPSDIEDRFGDDLSDDTKYNEKLQIVTDMLLDEFSSNSSETIEEKRTDQADLKSTVEGVPFNTSSTSPESKPDTNRKIKVQEEAKPDSLTFTVDGVSFKMIRVEGGTFTMGATSEQSMDAFGYEKPAHQVTLSTYYIGETQVTQALWETVMGSNPSDFKGANRPVETVSWNDCQTFIRKLNKATGKTFGLPTEAQWEYAARGGNRSKRYKYSGSDNLDEIAWYKGNAYDKGKLSPDYGTHDVKTKLANELGIYDMSGNVCEWCSDWYGGYRSTPQKNPKGPESGSGRVYRGGGWGDYAWICRSSHRIGNDPGLRGGTLGLRLSLSE